MLSKKGGLMMQFAARFRNGWMAQHVSLRAIIYMTVSSFCFAFVELAGLRLIEGITLYQVVWGRYAVHILFMVVILGPHYKTRLVRTNRLPIQIIRSLTMFAMPVCAILAMQSQMPEHDMWAVYWTSPLVMLGLSVLVLREAPGTTRWIATLVGFVGVLVFFMPDRGLLTPAIFLAFGMSLAVSLHLTLSRVLRHDHPLTSLFHTALWVFILMTFFVIPVWQTMSLRTVLGLVVIGIAGLVTLLLLARAGEIAPLPVAAAFSYTESIWRLLIKIVLFGIFPSKHMLLGGVIIAGVCGFLLWYELRQPDTAGEHVAAMDAPLGTSVVKS
jgi:drug/metabolite transporter (DMT)-like permease